MNAQNMPDSDLTIKKIERAAALKYDRKKDAAPRLAAKGKGVVAEKIREVAAAHDIPIHRDEDLIEMLDAVEIEQEIPVEIYAVVAEVFKYVYQLNQQKAK